MSHQKSRSVRWLLTTAILLLGVIVTIILVDPFSENDDSLTFLLSSGILRVGMDASYPPFEYIDPSTGEITGLDVDLADRISEALGVETVIVNIAYDGLFDALLVGQVDILISGLVDAPEYYAKATFSESYFNAGDIIVFLSDSEEPLLDALDGKTIGVEYGSGGDVEARQWQRRVANLTIQRFNTSSEALSALSTGTLDAVFLDGISARMGLSQYPNLALGERLNDKKFALAFHPDAVALRTAVGEILHQMIERGEMDVLIEKWFQAPVTTN